MKLLQNNFISWIYYSILFVVSYKAFNYNQFWATNLIVLSLLVYCVILFLKVKNKEKKGLIAGLTAIWLLIIPYKELYMSLYNRFAIQSFKAMLLLTGAVCILLISSVFFLTRGLIYSLENCTSKTYFQSRISAKNIIIYSVFPIVSFALTFIQDFPAKLSPDSKEQLAQIYGQVPFSDIHSIGHTLFMSLLMKVWNSPAVVIIFQVLVMSFTVGFALSYFKSKGFSEKMLMLISILFACFTHNKYMITWLWKDVLYSIAVLLISIMLMIYLERKAEIGNQYLTIGGLAAAGIFLFRHNGVVVYLSLIVIFIYLAWKFSKAKYFTPVILSILLIIVVRIYSFGYLNTLPNDHGAKYGIFAKAVVSVIANNGNINDDELKRVEKVVPIDIIHEYYSWNQGGGLMWLYGTPKYPSYFYNTAVEKNHNEVFDLFFELYPKNVRIMTWDILGSASLIWQFRIHYMDKNIPYMYFMIVSIIVLIKKDKRFIIPFIPVFSNALSIAISNTTYEPRYIYPTVAAFLFLVLYSYTVSYRQDQIV